MKLFKENSEADSKTISERVGNYLENKQRKVADYLNYKTRNLSGTVILYCLIFFSLVMAIYLLSLIKSAFN